MRKNNSGYIALVFILVLTVATMTIWGIVVSQSSRYKQFISGEVPAQINVSLTSTPAPVSLKNPFQDDEFYDMTMPYLRERNYDSEVENLKVFSQNTNYTAYTASYQSDGYRVNGYLTIPKGPVPRSPEGVVGWPAIVFIHGYIPPTIYETTQNYVSYVDYFARNGFVVFKPDLRGHDDSEGEAYGAYYSGDYVVDTLNAYSALQNYENVNPNAIGLWGHSMGGNVTFRSFVASKNIPALVIWAGAVYTYEDMSQFGIDDNSYRPPVDDSIRQKRRERLSQIHGDFNKSDPFWQTIVPTNYLDGVSGNIQINHATDDAVVSVEYSKSLETVLENYENINFELKTYNTGGHNIVSPNYEKAMQSSLDFYREQLK